MADSKHFTSFLRLVQDTGEAKKGKRLTIGHSSASKTVTLPDQPRPPAATGAPVNYTFDGVFTEGQSSFYKHSVRRLVDFVLTGYNGTVISLASQVTHEIRRKVMSSSKGGAIQKASRDVFCYLIQSRKKQADAASNLVVLCSFVLLINENIHDLLAGFSPESESGALMADNTIPPSLSLEKGTLVGACQQEVKNNKVMSSLLQYGCEMEKKIVQSYISDGASTVRPIYHTMCTLSVEYAQFGTMNAPISGSLSFVEVCPSDASSSNADAKVNQDNISLLTFADLVKSLSRNTTASVFPDLNQSGTLEKSPEIRALYEKSILTQLLKHALGGNCKTLLLTFAPKQFSTDKLEEIRTLLDMGSPARMIINHPNKKDLAEKALMNAYMRSLHKRYKDEDLVQGTSDKVAAAGGLGDLDERQRNMEEAFMALANAVDRGEGEPADSDSCSEGDDDLDPLLTSLTLSQTQQKRLKVRRKSSVANQAAPNQTDGIGDFGLDILINILQDPDSGAPRPSVRALNNVKHLSDVGAVFSGAAIVNWLLENIDGVETEEQAVNLGQLLLEKQALVHSEGSMVFANAESLFYYAKEGRQHRKNLSPQEIQQLLALAQISTEKSEKRKKGSDLSGHDTDTEEELSSSFNSPQSKKKKTKRKKLSINTIHEVDDDSRKVENNPLQSSINNDALSSSVPPSSSNPVSSEHIPSEKDFLINNTDTTPSTTPTTSADNVLHSDTATANQPSETQDETDDSEEEDASDPNTCSVKKIPTVQTLENTVDYPHPLHMAVAVGKKPGVVRELVMMFGVDILDDFQRTPLMFAALGNNKSNSVSALIHFGADVNKQDVSGLTSLHVACYHGNKAAASVLLSAGAVVDILDVKSHSAVHWSIVPESPSCLQLVIRHCVSDEVVRQVDSGGLTALHWAIHFKRPRHLKLLLKKYRYGDLVHLDKEGRTLVTYALQKGSLECMKVLISVCPSLLTFPDTSRSTPLHHASAQPSPQPLLYLLSCARQLREEESFFSVNCTNSYQRTPLHCAVAYNSVYNTDLLLRNGADVQVSDGEGKTPIDYAKDLENGEDVLAILEGGASVDWTDSPEVHQKLVPSSFSNSRFCTVS